MRLAAAAVVVVALVTSAALGIDPPRRTITLFREFERTRADTVPWADDIESGENGWTHGDLWATAVPHFHPDTYMAHEGGTSWWCGNFDYDEDGGYGNFWDDRLDVPATDWTGYTYPVLRFWERHDSEPGYDFAYVQAESGGVWININRGYNGATTWDKKEYYLGWYDNPAVLRFRFASDGIYSDEDGNYLSVGGGFSCDNIEIVDYATWEVIFWDDVETGGLCTPSVPSGGDYWRIIENDCQAFSDPHVWAIAYPDTEFVQPNLANWLQTPVMDISPYQPVYACTLRAIMAAFIDPIETSPISDGWLEQASVDGGETWTTVHSYWDHLCYYDQGPCDHYRTSIGIPDTLLPGASEVAFRWVVQTNADGCSPPPLCSYSSAGITIDDTWLEVFYAVTPAAAFAAGQAALELDGHVGGAAVGTFDVENTGNVDLESGQVTFEMGDLDGPGGGVIPGTSADVDPQTAAIPLDGGPVAFGLTIDVPGGLDTGDYEGSLMLYVDSDPADTLDVTVTLGLLSEPLAYPNPYRADAHESGGVTIALGGPGDGVKVKIYDMYTSLVRDLTDDVGEGDTEVFWNLENDEGEKVASGMYLVTIDDGGDVETLRIMIIK